MSNIVTMPSRRQLLHLAILLAGLIVPQAILFGPSLVGQKLLLPLDILKSGDTYLPPDDLEMMHGDSGEERAINPFRPHSDLLADQVLSYEIERQFVASEFRAGRIPLWSPFNYSGAAFVNWPKFSPFSLMYCLFPSPRSLAWIQLIKSLIGGAGAYFFFRRTLMLRFWPSTVAAWCFPLTAHFALWQGYPQTYATIWLPWILLVTDRVVRRPRSHAAPVLAVVTALVLISGQLDTAGHVLMASGVFAVYGLIRDYTPPLLSKRIAVPVFALVGGWGIGFLLAGPELLPLIDYSLTGSRLSDVSEIVRDRPPSGIRSLPRIVLPRIDGARLPNWFQFPGLGEFESASAAYTGLLAALVIAPMACCSRRHRSAVVVFVLLALLGLGWELNIPGIIHFLQLPVLNLRPHNRLVFVASFSILALTAIGLEVLWNKDLKLSRWFVVPPALLLCVGGYCVFRALHPPEPLATELVATLREGVETRDIPDMKTVKTFQTSYCNYMMTAAGLSLIGLAATVGLWSSRKHQRIIGILLAPLLCAELIWYGYGVNPQSDPELYYPKIPVLERLATLPPGRVLGIVCLPPKLNEIHGLYDIRGYDGVDPERYVQMLQPFRDSRFYSPPYAKTQYLVPLMTLSPTGELILPPVFDMLGLRYVIASSLTPVKPGLVPMPELLEERQEHGYHVFESKRALPRAFVPRTALPLDDPAATLKLMSRDDFSAREIAYVEGAVSVPSDCRGSATILSENSGEVRIAVEMQTKGLLVLADRWDHGWRAYSENRELPVLRTNYVLRGVVVTPEDSTIVFRYEPPSFTWGVRLLVLAIGLLACWMLACFRAASSGPPSTDGELTSGSG